MATYITADDVLSRCPSDFASIFASNAIMYDERNTARTAQVESVVSALYIIPVTHVQSPMAYSILRSIIADFVAGDILQQVRQEEVNMDDKVIGYAGGVLIARAQILLDKIAAGTLELVDAISNITATSVTIDGLDAATEPEPFFTRDLEF